MWNKKIRQQEKDEVNRYTQYYKEQYEQKADGTLVDKTKKPQPIVVEKLHVAPDESWSGVKK